jgi:alanine dehydrogenase
MIIGVPKEIKTHEYRVAVTPAGVLELMGAGHKVFCESSLGVGSGFSDAQYASAGAIITDKAGVFTKAELIVKVKEPQREEFESFRDGQALFTYLHLAPNRELIDYLLAKRISGFAYETLEHGGGLPLLTPMSEIAGRMAPIVGSYFLQRPQGGRGVLTAGAVGVPPAHVLILGAGIVGENALRVAHALGSEVTVINRGIEKLREIDKQYAGEVHTSTINKAHMEQALAEADLVVGAVYARGARAPHLVTREMLGGMKPGAVVVDVSIDQGGCFETSRPTTHDAPVFEVDGIIHYAVANMPGAYPNTSTRALTNATLPYLIKLAELGIKNALEDSELRTALNTHEGKLTHEGLAKSTGIELGNV